MHWCCCGALVELEGMEGMGNHALVSPPHHHRRRLVVCPGPFVEFSSDCGRRLLLFSLRFNPMREQEREIEKKRQERFSKSGRVWWEMGAATNQVELSQSLISSGTGFEVKIRISWPCCAHNGKTKIREKQKIKSVGYRKIKSVGNKK